MNTITAICDIKKPGKLKLVQGQKFKEALTIMPEGRYSLKLEKLFGKRTLKQNRANWGLAESLIRDCISDSYGYEVSKEFAHQICMENCLPESYVERLKENHKPVFIVNKLTGEEKEIPFRLTSKEMTTVESMEYYKNLQLFGAEFFSINIPDPDPDYKTI